MSDMANRSEIINTLNEMEVEFPSTATNTQLRWLLHDGIGDGAIADMATNSAHDHTAVSNNSTTAAADDIAITTTAVSNIATAADIVITTTATAVSNIATTATAADTAITTTAVSNIATTATAAESAITTTATAAADLVTTSIADVTDDTFHTAAQVNTAGAYFINNAAATADALELKFTMPITRNEAYKMLARKRWDKKRSL
ncbi:uncharacterized protein [Eurosta solidaginis]|uniref:uncharacterized protein n=1 Tax=Eurosta solidaginis TaxID=178769 RepID=UPI0035312C52